MYQRTVDYPDEWSNGFNLMAVEEPAPGTRDLLAEWQLMHTPIEIFATDEELRALEADA